MKAKSSFNQLIPLSLTTTTLGPKETENCCACKQYK